jgi:hypothetical protein
MGWVERWESKGLSLEYAAGIPNRIHKAIKKKEQMKNFNL